MRRVSWLWVCCMLGCGPRSAVVRGGEDPRQRLESAVLEQHIQGMKVSASARAVAAQDGYGFELNVNLQLDGGSDTMISHGALFVHEEYFSAGCPEPDAEPADAAPAPHEVTCNRRLSSRGGQGVEEDAPIVSETVDVNMTATYPSEDGHYRVTPGNELHVRYKLGPFATVEEWTSARTSLARHYSGTAGVDFVEVSLRVAPDGHAVIELAPGGESGGQ